MLKTKSVTTVTTASEEKENASYELVYDITDGVIGQISCVVFAKNTTQRQAPEGLIDVPQLIRAGDICLKNGIITPSAFAAELPIAEYLTVFGELVKEITDKAGGIKTTK